MKKIFAIFVTIVGLILQTSLFQGFPLYAQSSKPFSLSSPEGKFSIIFPSLFPKPQKSTANVQTQLGDVPVTMYVANSQMGACIVGFNDMPAKTLKEKSPQKIMSDSEAGALRNMNAQLEKHQNYSYQGFPAHRLYFSLVNKGKEGHGRFDYVLANSRMYQVGIVGPKSLDLNYPEITHFFNSFRIQK